MKDDRARAPARWSAHPAPDNWIRVIAGRLGAQVPEPTSPVFAHLRHALLKEDELGQELAEWVKQHPSHRGQFEALLETDADTPVGPAIPPVLARLQTELLDNRPAWADPAKMALGADAHYRIGDIGRLASGTLGLLDGYRCVPVARVLTMTGSLETATGRRLEETAKFMNSVLDSDGMRRGSDGFKAALRVRLVHAFVRHGIRRNPAWKADQWGIPLSIMDSLGTAMSFWLPVIIAAPVFGYSVSREEAEGMMTLWNYVGWLQGVPSDLLPTTLEDTYAIYLGILTQIGRGDEESLKLANSYVAAASRNGDGTSWFRKKLVVGAASRLLPADHRKQLGIDWTVFRYWWDLTRPLIRKQDRLCHSDPAAYRSAVDSGRRSAISQLPSDLAEHDAYDPDKVIRNHSQLT